MVRLPNILRNQQFLKLWGNQVLLQVGINMSNYTALLILADRTHSPFVQAQFYAALTLPAFVFGMIAGPIVDMSNKKTLMLITDAILAMLLFCYALSTSSVFLLLLIAFATASVSRFFIPAEAASIPQVVEKEILHHANAFFLFTLLGSVLVGYMLAGPLIQFFGGLHSRGETMPFILASGLLVIGFFLRLSLKQIAHTVETPQGNFVKKTFLLLKETLQEVTKDRLLFLPLLFLIFVELNIGIMSVVLLGYVHTFLQLPLTHITYILIMPFIVGLGAGMAVLGKIEKTFGYKNPVLFSCFGIALAYLVLGIMPWLFQTNAFVLLRGISVGIAFFIGVCIVFLAVSSRTMLQLRAASHMHGRIFSFLDIMIALATPVPVLLLGLFADNIGLLQVLDGIGIAFFLVTLFGILLV